MDASFYNKLALLACFFFFFPKKTCRLKAKTKKNKKLPSWLSITVSPEATPSESFITHHPLSTVLSPQCCLGDRSLRFSSLSSQAAFQSGVLPANQPLARLSWQPRSHHFHRWDTAESHWHFYEICTSLSLSQHKFFSESLPELHCTCSSPLILSVSMSPPRMISISSLQSVMLKDGGAVSHLMANGKYIYGQQAIEPTKLSQTSFSLLDKEEPNS